MKDIKEKIGIKIMIIKNEMDVIRRIDESVIVIDKGLIEEEGKVWKVLENKK